MAAATQRRSRRTFRASARAPGFTLIELIVTIAVAAILLAIAIPSFNTTLLNNRRAAAVNDFVGAVTYARGVAVSRRKTVTICRSTLPSSSTPTCDTSTANNWNEGWVVFVDGSPPSSSSTTPTFATTTDPTTTDELLRSHEPISGGINLRGTGDTGSNIAKWITFQGTGTTSDSGAVVICDSRGWTTDARVVAVTAGGRARSINQADYGSQTPAVSSCTP